MDDAAKLTHLSNILVSKMNKLRSRKFRKISDWKRANVVDDRLSGLPDDILIHILALLPTKTYVATSILGRRWRFLWARVPNLDFNDEHFDEKETGANSFSSIVNRVMFLQKREKINSFRFSHLQETRCCDDDEFDKWVSTAIDCNVQELDLLLGWDLSLPICIFTCKTLVNLRLAWLDMPTIENTVCLPSLKKLLLGMVFFGSVECFHHLLSGCPVLDELCITNEFVLTNECFFQEETEISCCISSPTLHRLELEEIKWNKERVFRVNLDTPALKYLKLENYVPYFSHEDLPEVFSVPHSAFFASTKTFHNLIELELEAAEWCFIPSFLEKANNLQVLTIHSSCGEDNPSFWINPNQVPACLVEHLRTVRIHDFCCAEQEFNAVRFLLRNAKVLKRMEIYTRSSGIKLKKQHEALKRISWYKRGSEACRIVFY